MEMIIKKYVTEVFEELSNFINDNHKILIEAPTESGKSTFVKKFIENNPDKHIVFAMPTRILVDNFGNGGTIKSGYGNDFLCYTEEKESIITTYDSLASDVYKKNEPDIVFIDEAHLLAGHGDFRRIIETILCLKCKVVLISGTPEVIELIEGYQKIIITSKSRVYRDCTIYEVKDQPYITAKNIINEPKENILKIIRLNSKSTIQDLYDEFSPFMNCAIYYSTNKENIHTINELYVIQDIEIIEKIKVGIIPKEIDVLFTTSIIDSGLTLKVSRETDIHVISNENKRLPNAIDVCQIPYRVRSDDGKCNLYVYGNFGTSEIEDNLPKTKNISNLISYMAKCYDNYRDLYENLYQGVLEKYGIRSHIKRLKKTTTKSLSRVSDYDIANNLNSFNYLHLTLKNRCSKWNFNKLKPTHAICGKRLAKATNICNLLLDADKNQISFDIFLKDNRLYSKKLKSLISVKTIHKKNKNFSFLIDTIIESYLNNTQQKFKINNTFYFTLNKNEQDIFKEFVNTLFKADRFDRNILTIERVKCDEVKEYVMNLINKININNQYNKVG